MNNKNEILYYSGIIFGLIALFFLILLHEANFWVRFLLGAVFVIAEFTSLYYAYKSGGNL